MQTAVDPKGQPVAFAGLIADSDELVDVVSGFSEESSAEMAFGIGVKQGTAAQSGKIPSTSADVIKGVLAFSFNHAPGQFGDLGTTGIIAGGRLRLLRHGRIWLLMDAGVTSIAPFADRAWLRFETDGASNIVPGRWGKASDTHNIDLTKVVQFVGPLVTLADGTKIAKAEVNFTAKP